MSGGTGGARFSSGAPDEAGTTMRGLSGAESKAIVSATTTMSLSVA
jgi:hypothetical protein